MSVILQEFPQKIQLLAFAVISQKQINPDSLDAVQRMDILVEQSQISFNRAFVDLTNVCDNAEKRFVPKQKSFEI